MKTFDQVFSTDKYHLRVEQRHPSGMGRFGGGWNYRLGITGGTQSLLINSEVFFMRLRVPKKAIINKTFEVPGYLIRIDMRIPGVAFEKLLTTKEVIITSSKKEVYFKIKGVGKVVITKL